MPPIRVLVVDDDPMVQQVNRDYVEAVPGFRVVGTARTGREALAAVRQHRPDLVLLDIYMPDQDGVWALKEIRRQEMPADVVVVTAAQEPQTVEEILRYGAVDYIIKPFRMQRLHEALRNYRAAKQRLARAEALDQEQVDRMLRERGLADAWSDLPKGLNEATLRQVREFLAGQQTALSAVEVADRLGTARVTARRYLDFLVRRREARLEVQYGSVGRPVNRYRLAQG